MNKTSDIGDYYPIGSSIKSVYEKPRLKEGRMMNKTCNGIGMCQYKTVGGSMPHCSYAGYCDYQAPRDSSSTEEGGDDESI